jgi:serine protease Do
MSADILEFGRPPQDALMALRSIVPETAMTAELLGTERNSHAVQVSPDGLLLTVGYSVLEASQVLLTNRRGETSEAIILAQDFDSGIALLMPQSKIGLHHLETTTIHTLSEGDELQILTSDEPQPIPVELAAMEEYSGRWEYLLDKALYTVPLYERWSGAALVNRQNQLCGLGSLALGIRNREGHIEPGNLFIPVDLVMPHIEYLLQHGKKPGGLRPWLGTLVEEHNSEIYVVGIYHGAPAALAGVRPGDVIAAVNNEKPRSVTEFLRTVWRQGEAGTEIRLTLNSGKETREATLESTDRNSFFTRHAAGTLN